MAHGSRWQSGRDLCAFDRCRIVDETGGRSARLPWRLTRKREHDGGLDAFNPAELFLAALAACMIKGIERAMPMLKFDLRGVEVKLHGVRQDSPPKMNSIDYELIVDTDETDHRLELLHGNVRKYGTISNTIAEAVRLEGVIRRKV
ncbi:OsmC family protein [Methylocella tundrae]|uniref:OsmC family protein n=1 Tax=Methylocella tundrae TaxID=227605 RepID=UPI00106A5D9B|nr:OsmC family protein [Methylocella tundrae]